MESYEVKSTAAELKKACRMFIGKDLDDAKQEAERYYVRHNQPVPAKAFTITRRKTVELYVPVVN